MHRLVQYSDGLEFLLADKMPKKFTNLLASVNHLLIKKTTIGTVFKISSLVSISHWLPKEKNLSG
jgi:hypothetical protein